MRLVVVFQKIGIMDMSSDFIFLIYLFLFYVLTVVFVVMRAVRIFQVLTGKDPYNNLFFILVRME